MWTPVKTIAGSLLVSLDTSARMRFNDITKMKLNLEEYKKKKSIQQVKPNFANAPVLKG